MLLEGEDYLLQRNINRLLNGESLAAVLGPDEGGKAGDDSTLGFNELDDLHKRHAQDLENAKNALDDEAARQRRALQEKLKNRRKAKLQECRDSGMMEEEINRVEREQDEAGVAHLEKLDASLANRNERMLSGIQKKQLRVVEEVMKLNRVLTAEELEDLDAKTGKLRRKFDVQRRLTSLVAVAFSTLTPF